MNDALKYKTKTVHTIDAFDLEDFVNEYFGFVQTDTYSKPYSFQATEECGNDTSHEFAINGYVDDWSDGELRQWMSNNGSSYISNHTILDHLCREGVIPAGDYVVRLSY